jgi:hypothetical protein
MNAFAKLSCHEVFVCFGVTMNSREHIDVACHIHSPFQISPIRGIFRQANDPGQVLNSWIYDGLKRGRLAG